MELLTSKVPRALDSKAKLFGFELADLVVVLLYLSVSNLLFGSTPLKFPLVWAATMALALFLYFFKKGKPENYLFDLGEYLFKPDVFSAGAADLEYRPYLPFQRLAEKE